MLKDISLGRFVDTGSDLHKLDPRIKIILYIFYLVAIFMVNKPVGIISIAIVTIAQYIYARIPLRVVKSTLTPILPLAIFILILNLFTIRTGEIIWEWKLLHITDDGVFKGLLMLVRLILLILSTSVLLTLTTTPLKIADALESLGAPLKKIKVPVHEMSMMMSIALRFIPTLVDETDKIMKAQVSRGADYDTGSFLNRLKGYVAVLVPLFVSSFKRADELATAMDARCYRGGEGRTKLNPLKITNKDIVIGIIFAILPVICVILEKLL